MTATLGCCCPSDLDPYQFVISDKEQEVKVEVFRSYNALVDVTKKGPRYVSRIFNPCVPLIGEVLPRRNVNEHGVTYWQTR